MEMKPKRRSHWLNDALKRGVDILAALVGLVILSPVFITIGLWIKRESPGPVFYRGPRVGKDGRLFKIVKFRTMRETAESYQGPRVTAQDDPRVTQVGRWLRDTKLNELPQLWNVLVGEMSLVGPRPEDPEIGKTWPLEVRREVLSVRPGITSPASVIYRDEESLLQTGNLMDTYLGDIMPSKLRLDQLYVRHRSFLLDLDIMFYTFLVLMPMVGAGAPQEERLFLGPLSKLARRYVSWFMLDVVVTFLAIGAAGIFWRSFGALNVGWWKAIAIALGFAVLYSLVGAAMGVNRIAWSHARLVDAIDLLPAVALATIIALLLNFVWTAQPVLPPMLLMAAALLAYSGFVMVRFRSRLLQSLAARWLMMRGGALQAQERVLIVGSGESGRFISWWLQNGQNQGVFRVTGFVDDDLYKQDTRIRGVNVLGRREDIPRLVKEHDIGIILFAIHNISTEERRRLLDICGKTGARLFTVPDVLGKLREAALDDLLNGKRPAQGEAAHDEPLAAMADEIGAAQMDAWLAQLGEMAAEGRLEAVQEQIRQIRERLGAGSVQPG